MLPSLFRKPDQKSQGTIETDTWYVSYGAQESYDAIVKEADEWRKQAAIKKSKNRFSFLTNFLSRKEPAFFVVDQEAPPRLYRLNDEKAGEITFELAEVEEGGTSIKSTYNSTVRALMQDFKAKMPIKIPAFGQKVCPSCGNKMMPDFKTCPFCGTELAS